MIGFELTKEQKQLQEVSRKFANKEIRPIAAQIDNIADPRKSFPINVIKKGFELGFHTLLVPEKYGGIGGNTLDYSIMLEELAAGDIGIANAFHATMALSNMIAKNGTEEQCERWLRPLCEDKTGSHLIAFGATEPSGGTEIFCPLPNPKLGTKTTAKKVGDHYLVNGRKVFSRNGGAANLYGVMARTNTIGANSESCSIFFFSSDTPGFSVGTIENKMGHRASMNGELIFEDMKIPKENMLGEEGAGFEAMHRTYSTNGVGTGSMAVGLARSAYEVALDYAKQRKIWGQPISKYQAIGNLLVDMKAEIEMARLIVRRVAWGTENASDEGKVLPHMAKVYPAEMARRVTVNAMQVLGGYGYMKDYPVEKYVRDAMVLPIIGGGNEVLKYFMSLEL